MAGLTHEYWVEEKHHLVIFERIGDWAGHLTASLTWKEQRLNFTVERESFVFAPPPGAIRAADPLGIPEPHCEAAFPYTALPSETTPADFTLPDQAGQAVRFAELKGTPIVLTFWHTWSPLAAAQLRELEQFQKQRGARGVVVLGYTDEPPEVVRAFLQKNGLTLRTMIDRDHSATWLCPPDAGLARNAIRTHNGGGGAGWKERHGVARWTFDGRLTAGDEGEREVSRDTFTVSPATIGVP